MKRELKVVGWNRRSFDTVITSNRYLKARLLMITKPGSILLLHDNLEQTQQLINNKELSDILINQYYKNSHKSDKCDDTHIIFDDKVDDNEDNSKDNNTYQVHISDSCDTDNTDDDNIDDI